MAALLSLCANNAHATVGVKPALAVTSNTPLPSTTVLGRKWFTDNTITFGIAVNANGEPGPVTITCKLDDAPAAPCPGLVQQTATTYSFTFGLIADGSHDVTIAVTDAEGDSQNATVLVGVDTQDPLVTFERPVGPVVRTTLSEFVAEFSVFDGFFASAPAAECRLDGGDWNLCEQFYVHTLYGLMRQPISGLSAGIHTFNVRATDLVNRTTVNTLTIHVQAPGQGVDVEMPSSTTFSAAHPDLRIDLTNNTDQDLISFGYRFPDGLFLNSAAVPGQNADGSRCPYPYLADFFTNCDEQTKQDTRVGSAQATVDIGGQEVVLDGSIHIVDSMNGDEPAALVYAIDATIGALDFGTIVIPARLAVVSKEGDPMVYEDLIRGPTGLDLVVDSMPTELEDLDHGNVDFTIKRLTLDLEGDAGGGSQPFITSPSSCEPGSAIATVITDDNESHISQPSHSSTDCDAVAFEPVIDQFQLTSNVKNDAVGLSMNVHLPDKNSTIEGVQLDLPRSLATNSLAYGTKCLPSQVMRQDPEDDGNGGCPASTVVGTASISTPLSAAPITGNVYIEDSGESLPHLFFNVRDGSIGVNARLRALTEVVAGSSSGQIRLSFDTYSDGGPRSMAALPITDLAIDLPGTHQGAGGSLTPLFKIAATCNPTDFAFARFSSHARPGEDLYESISPSLTSTGCTDTAKIDLHETLFSPVEGGTTSSTSAAFRLNWTGGGSTTFRCSLDDAPFDTNCGTATPSASIVKQFSGLADGVHKLTVAAGSPEDQDVFIWKVDTTVPRDIAAPVAPVITSGPIDGSTSADSTPNWLFTSSDGVGTPAIELRFQCRLDGAAYVSCGTGSPGHFDSPELAGAAASFDGQHEFSVRTQDKSGNVSASTDVTFTVAKPFAPTIVGEVSDSAISANPAVSVEFGNESSDDLRDVTISLPDEMSVNPNSVAQVCTFASASVAGCPAGSQVGTVEAVVQVDRSRLKLPGLAYLVEAATVTDLNRLAVVIDPTIGAIDFGGKIVMIGQGIARTSPAGVDYQFESMPISVMDAPKSTAMAFRMRSLKLDFAQSPDGNDPQFTNPSNCTPRSFGISLTTYADIFATATDPFTPTGCYSPPPVVDITSPSANSVTNDNTPALTFTVTDPAATCTLSIDGGSTSAVTSGVSLTALADGLHTTLVNCTNSAGGGSDTHTFRVDTTAPTVVISSPATGSVTTDATPTLDFSVNDAGDATPSCDTADGADLGPFSQGVQSVTVTCLDDAGNAGTATTSFTVAEAGFNPALSASLSGRSGAAASPGQPAALALMLTTAPGDERAAALSVDLPSIIGVSVANLPDALCEAGQAAAGACPAGSRVGSATANAGALSGTVFMLRGASSSAPDIAVVFTGQSNWLRGSRTTVAGGRMRLSFIGQPAALPVTGLSLAIDGFFTLTSEACGAVDLSLPTSTTSENGETVTLNSQLSIQGSGLPSACSAGLNVKAKFSNRAKKSTLAITAKADAGQPLGKLSITLPNGLKQVKKSLAKKLVVKANGKRLAAKCFKFRSTARLDIGLCGKPASKVEIAYKSGALIAVKKVTGKTKFKLVATPLNGAPLTLKPALATR